MPLDATITTTDGGAPVVDAPPAVATPPAVALPADLVERLVAKLNAPVAPVTVTPTAPVEDPLVAARREHDTRLTTAKKEYARLQADGKYEEALDAILSAATTPVPTASRDVAREPAYIALAESVRDRVERRHADVVKSYATEIDTEIAALAPDQRIVADQVDAAISRVKSRHVDDLVAARVKEGVEAALAAASTAPMNMPNAAWGETSAADFAGMTRSERELASFLGVPAKQYAAAKRAMESAGDGATYGYEIPGA